MIKQKLKMLLTSDHEEHVRQALDLILQLEGMDDVVQLGFDLLHLDADLQTRLQVNWTLRKSLSHQINDYLKQAIIYVLLKGMEKWKQQKTLYLLYFNPELEHVGFYADLNQIEFLWVDASLLHALGSLNSLKEITIYGQLTQWDWLKYLPKSCRIHPCGATPRAVRTLIDHEEVLSHLETLINPLLNSRSHFPSHSSSDSQSDSSLPPQPYPISSIQTARSFLHSFTLDPEKEKRILKIAAYFSQYVLYQIQTLSFKMIYIPPHQIDPPFLMMETPMTQSLYRCLHHSNPSDFKGEMHPVERISFTDALRTCNLLSQKLRFDVSYPNFRTVQLQTYGFRLPFNHEWEWAAQGGDSFRFAGSNTLDEVGWYWENAQYKTHPVAQKKPNGYGLYDLSGNVNEWCIDEKSPGANPEVNLGKGLSNPSSNSSLNSTSISFLGGSLRGGSWYTSERKCRLTYFDQPRRIQRTNRTGLRVVQPIDLN